MVLFYRIIVLTREISILGGWRCSSVERKLVLPDPYGHTRGDELVEVAVGVDSIRTPNSMLSLTAASVTLVLLARARRASAMTELTWRPA